MGSRDASPDEQHARTPPLAGPTGIELPLIATLLDSLANQTRPGPFRVWVLGVLALGLVVPLCLIASPGVYLNDTPQDLAVPLDGAYRVMRGQWPHVDFHTPIGVTWYAWYGTFMSWYGGAAVSLLAASSAFGVLAGAVTWVVCAGRLGPALRAWAAVCVTTTAASPRTLDLGAVSHLATYNKWGWALVATLALALLLPARERPRWREGLEAGLCTVVLLVLATTKLTYFLLGGTLVVLAVLLVPENRRVALGAGIGTWLALGLWAALSVVPWAYIADLSDAVRASQGASRGFWLRAVPANGVTLLVIGGLLAAALPAIRAEGLHRTFRGVTAVGCATAATVLVGYQSHDLSIPSLGMLALVAACVVERSAGAVARRVTAGLLWVALLITGDVYLRDVVAAASNTVGAQSDRLATPLWSHGGDRLGAVRVTNTAPPGALETAQGIAAGRIAPTPVEKDSGPILQLQYDDLAATLDALSLHEARFFEMRMANTINWAFDREPPRGVRAWYDHHRTFGPASPITLDELAEVDVVVDSRQAEGPESPPREFVLPLIRDWNRHETPFWILYIRP